MHTHFATTSPSTAQQERHSHLYLRSKREEITKREDSKVLRRIPRGVNLLKGMVAG